MSGEIQSLNLIILSMKTKQDVFDKLNNDVINIDIFTGYIDTLIEINLQLMGIEDIDAKKKRYYDLIDQFINGEIENPEEIVGTLQENNILN